MTPDTTIAAADVLRVAASQLGIHEDPPGSNRQKFGEWYGMNGAPWCAMFVSWVLHEAGYPLAISTPKGYAYCPAGVDWFKAQGRWAGPDVTPEPGWVVFFDFPDDKVNRASHTGLVKTPDATGVNTYEGNTNDAGGRTGGEVLEHHRTVAGGIIGYGIITYSTGQDDDMPLNADDKKWLDAKFASLASDLAARVNIDRDQIIAEVKADLAKK